MIEKERRFEWFYHSIYEKKRSFNFVGYCNSMDWQDKHLKFYSVNGSACKGNTHFLMRITTSIILYNHRTQAPIHPHLRSKFWVESLFDQMYAFELPLPDDGYLSS